MGWILLKGALGASLLLILWVAIERAWQRSVGTSLAASIETGTCPGCLVCTRRCGEKTHDSQMNYDEPGDAPWS